MVKVRRFEVRYIDAWRDRDGWYWNSTHRITSGVVLAESEITPRKIFRFLRTNGWLSTDSKGNVALQDDGDVITVVDKDTREPVLALLSYGDQ